MVFYIIALVVVSVPVLYLLRNFFKGGVCKSTARLDGKTVIITGANTGIGKETAKDLAGRGARVILACRDLEKANQAAAEVKKTSGNQNVIVKKLDLASLASVREFAADINKEESRLDILLNNAGVMWCPYMKTKDGFEMQFGVNHLGHFLLTNLLLDLLKKSAPSRIVTVSSMGHAFVKRVCFEDLNGEKSYNTMHAYSQSKLANILFTRELSKRLEGTGVTANSLHPGAVDTDLSRYIPRILWNILYAVLYPMWMLVLKMPKDGAQTSIHCAVAEELDGVSGLYFSDCAVKEPTSQAKDDGVAKKLWEVSADMVGLDN
ncbi:retinol dehydrogenase 11-like [Ptychodera flava]|uniref:retinol dehydrogenase 11-like n=1 Tax=Ptychodera flava TaxID=63121 RepID=UPI00396AB09A